ncbi:hypothetical protein TorRG33x02_341260 [Trema orientale]|uniref:Tyrosine-protein kinase n=1 Tax=Trema orientale TaxID=63057 RepID=A0A2P5AU76_TREOI|nr:hypothetical protein TorRG33x02_341260 [Trema orientale]
MDVGNRATLYRALRDTGVLPSEQEIAVKKLSQSSGQGIQEFKNKVILIAKHQQWTLVSSWGFCIQGEERMLSQRNVETVHVSVKSDVFCFGVLLFEIGPYHPDHDLNLLGHVSVEAMELRESVGTNGQTNGGIAFFELSDKMYQSRPFVRVLGQTCCLFCSCWLTRIQWFRNLKNLFLLVN